MDRHSVVIECLPYRFHDGWLHNISYRRGQPYFQYFTPFENMTDNRLDGFYYRKQANFQVEIDKIWELVSAALILTQNSKERKINVNLCKEVIC